MLFEPSDRHHVFAIPPGCEFAREFVDGLLSRLANRPPEDIAAIEVYLPTVQVKDLVVKEFALRGPGFLPALRVTTELARDDRFPEHPGPIPSLRRQLHLFQAVLKLLRQDERFAARATAFDLATSLADLMDEMRAEGVHPSALEKIDLSADSAHWDRSLTFIKIIRDYWEAEIFPDAKARQRFVAEGLARNWTERPPDHPVIFAGSTGSRGPTRMLMEAVATLPQGAVILPCFDFEMPEDIWNELSDPMTGEDHPQFRIKKFLDAVKVAPGTVAFWHAGSSAPVERNRLVSLALRPAPVTSQWMHEGPRLEGIDIATRDMSIIEAPDPRTEALAVALRLREAVENGRTAALVTPDSSLSRQVKAALARWNLFPDDGKALRLAKTSYGQLLDRTAGLMTGKPDAVALISLLKHPLVHDGGNRNAHFACTTEIELKLRERGLQDDFPRQLRDMIESSDGDGRSGGRLDSAWVEWLCAALSLAQLDGERPLEDFTGAHRELVEHLLRGFSPNAGGDSHETARLWSKNYGKRVLEVFETLQAEAPQGGMFDAETYGHLVDRILNKELTAQRSATPWPGISIWETLDALMRSPDLVIAGGLNDAVWPGATPKDPWMSRDMRKQVGLLLPERTTGLAAHDFQQSISAREVVLTRSLRDSSGPTVPSRWLNRLTNLLGGLGNHGRTAIEDMRARGGKYIEIAQSIETPASDCAPALRPEPKPPIADRPKRLSVTAIQQLITNPYEIYARHVLKLREIPPLRAANEAALRGTALHEALARFVQELAENPDNCTPEQLIRLGRERIEAQAVRPYLKAYWLARLEAVAPEFLKDERTRAVAARPVLIEQKGEIAIDGLDFTLSARLDRVDRDADGGLHLYDYKTGTLPTPKTIERYDKQIPLTAIMLERGAFEGIADAVVKSSSYIKIGNAYERKPVAGRPREEGEADIFAETWDRFEELIRFYRDESNGYLARLNMSRRPYGETYDHLARYGEWDESTPRGEGRD